MLDSTFITRQDETRQRIMTHMKNTHDDWAPTVISLVADLLHLRHFFMVSGLVWLVAHSNHTLYSSVLSAASPSLCREFLLLVGI